MPANVKGRTLPTDVHVGRRIRAIRKARHLTQEKLAGEMGISFQQLQKYETSANRITASKMLAAAQALGVSISAFFEGLEDISGSKLAPEMVEFISQDGALEVAAGYIKLTTSQRRAVTSLMNNMANEAG